MVITNEQMKEGRYLRWHRARRRLAFILGKFDQGWMVQITTMTRAVRYTAKHRDLFKATRTGTYVLHGKRWDCIDHCDIRAFNI